MPTEQRARLGLRQLAPRVLARRLVQRQGVALGQRAESTPTLALRLVLLAQAGREQVGIDGREPSEGGVAFSADVGDEGGELVSASMRCDSH